MRVEAGTHHQVSAVTVADASVGDDTNVGATAVRCLLGQTNRLVQFNVSAGVGDWDIQAEGSIDGNTWFILGTAFTGNAVDVRVEQVAATPQIRLHVTDAGSPVYNVEMVVTE